MFSQKRDAFENLSLKLTQLASVSQVLVPRITGEVRAVALSCQPPAGPEGVMPQHCSPGRLWPGGAKRVSPEASFCSAVLGMETGDFPQPCRNCPIRVGAAVQLGLQELRGGSRGLCLEPLGGLPGGGGTWPSLGRGGGRGCI